MIRPLASQAAVTHRRPARWRWLARGCLAAALGTGLVPPIEAAAPMTNAAPVPDAFVLRHFELIPPLVTPPRLQAVSFPREQPGASVEELVYFANRLWVIARARTASPAPAPRRLWTFSLDLNRFEPVKGVLDQYTPESLCGYGSELWMAVRGGAAAMHVRNFAVEGFNATQGLTATNLVGIGEVDGQLVAFSESGLVFGLDRTGTNFVRLGSPAPAANPRTPDPWKQFVTSSSFLLALATRTAAGRHAQGTEWISFSDTLAAGSARASPLRFATAAGDGVGGFWAGSDAGLHWLNPSNGAADSWFWPIGVTIHSGLPAIFTPATRPSPAAVSRAQDRVAAGIRDRMRERARLARVSLELKRVVDPVTPTSRLPGAVRALHRDGQWLWIATADSVYAGRNRILLFHQPTHKWVAWFPVNARVNAICAAEQLLYLGLDVTSAPGGNPLVVLDKTPLTSIHSSKWAPDELTNRELGERLASLPVRERAVYAFFARDNAQVVDLLKPTAGDASAEELFLLAFANDPLGLDQPREFELYAEQLIQRWPDTPFGEIMRGLRSQQPVAQPATAAPATPPVVQPPPEAVSLAEVFSKWDKDGDGAINAAELKEWLGAGVQLGAFDLDGDAQLGPSEILALLKQRASAQPGKTN